MQLKNYIYILIFILASSMQALRAQIPILSDSSKVSLLTNTPWDGAVYALFGHTAIRVSDPVNDVDVVFNYGLFDYDSPNFMYRFAKGETDYAVGYTSANRYLIEYQMKGIGVSEQNLNLSQSEKQKIFKSLLENCEPQNRIYRYNYFYDNCTTRARDMIDRNIDGSIIYSDLTKDDYTYRKLVHECVNSEPWVRFGIDLVIGADADKPILQGETQYLPAYLMRDFDGASIKDINDTTRKLVSSKIELLEQTSLLGDSNPLNTPLIVGIVLLIISALISYLCYIKNKKTLAKIFDFLLFFVAGIAGSVIFFLMFFSVHPCTNPNWNLIWLNPVQLIFAFLFLIKFFSKSVYYYHFINFVLLIMFLLAWFLIPQYLEVAFVPYILALAMRSGMNVLQYKKEH